MNQPLINCLRLLGFSQFSTGATHNHTGRPSSPPVFLLTVEIENVEGGKIPFTHNFPSVWIIRKSGGGGGAVREVTSAPQLQLPCLKLGKLIFPAFPAGFCLGVESNLTEKIDFCW